MTRIEYYAANNHTNAKSVVGRSSVFRDAIESVDEYIRASEFVEVGIGENLIKQNERDKDVYLVVEGEFDILVNGRGVARRSVSEILGEMSVVDPASKRSATVVASENSIVLKTSEAGFVGIANRNPTIWRNIASEIARRLRQRGDLVDAKGTTSRLFIGSSGEYLPVAHAIQKGLMRTDLIVNVWNQDCFRPSSGSLNSLESEMKRSDFALLLFGDDDVTCSRDATLASPRDNVVFELGLFMGHLSSKRVFFAKEIDKVIKMPSDLFGISPIEYRRKSGEDISISVQPICSEIIRITNELGAK